jgi:hypothetical protein
MIITYLPNMHLIDTDLTTTTKNKNITHENHNHVTFLVVKNKNYKSREFSISNCIVNNR